MMESKAVINSDSDDEFEVDDPKEMENPSDVLNSSATAQYSSKRGRRSSAPIKNNTENVDDDDEEEILAKKSRRDFVKLAISPLKEHDRVENIPSATAKNSAERGSPLPKSTSDKKKNIRIVDYDDEENEEGEEEEDDDYDENSEEEENEKEKEDTDYEENSDEEENEKEKEDTDYEENSDKEENEKEEEDNDYEENSEEEEKEEEDDDYEDEDIVDEEEQYEEFNQGPNDTPAEKFTSGAFIVLKTDIISEENPPVWKIDGPSLLRKYIAFEQDGKVLYKSTANYFSWSPSVKDNYYDAPISFVLHTKKEHIITFYKNKIEKDPKVEETVKKEMIENKAAVSTTEGSN